MDEPHVFDTVLMPETIDPVVIANINRAADTVDDVDIKVGDQLVVLQDDGETATVQHVPTDQVITIPNNTFTSSQANIQSDAVAPTNIQHTDEEVQPEPKRHGGIPPGIFILLRNLCVFFAFVVFLAWLVMGGLWLQNMNEANKPNLNYMGYFWSSIGILVLFFVVIGAIILLHYTFKICKKKTDRRTTRRNEEREQLKAAQMGESRRNIKMYPFFGYTAVRESAPKEV